MPHQCCPINWGKLSNESPQRGGQIHGIDAASIPRIRFKFKFGVVSASSVMINHSIAGYLIDPSLEFFRVAKSSQPPVDTIKHLLKQIIGVSIGSGSSAQEGAQGC